MNVGVIGCGYVGLAAAVGLAGAGHRVRALEIDPSRRASLRARVVPFAEADLQAELGRHDLRFPDTLPEAVDGAEVVLVAVPTPDRGSLDAVRDVLRAVGAIAVDGAVVAMKSTVPPDAVDELVAALREASDGRARLVINPEFLRQGSALADFRAPARIVLGGEPDAVAVLASLYAPLLPAGTPVLRTDARSAALAKLAANAMLAVRVAFGNDLRRASAALGADHDAVLSILAADPRIGGAHLRPSLGIGGGCLPKDSQMLLDAAAAAGSPLGVVSEALRSNEAQLDWVCTALSRALGRIEGRRVALWGLAFKAGTGDLRGSAPLALAQHLARAGAHLVAHDPLAAIPEPFEPAAHPVAAVAGADALVVGTAWPDYAALDPAALAPRRRLALDPAGALPAARWRAAGWTLWP